MRVWGQDHEVFIRHKMDPWDFGHTIEMAVSVGGATFKVSVKLKPQEITTYHDTASVLKDHMKLKLYPKIKQASLILAKPSFMLE